MTLTVKTTIDTGTFLHPTFRAYQIIEKIVCVKIQYVNDLAYLYNWSGYVSRVVAKSEIIEIEK